MRESLPDPQALGQRDLAVGTAALLVFLAAATRTRIVATHFWQAVMNWFDHGDRRAGSLGLTVGAGCFAGHGCGFSVTHRCNLPQRANKARALLLDAENCRR